MSKTETSAVQVRTADEIVVGTGLDTEAKIAKDRELADDVQEETRVRYVTQEKLDGDLAIGRKVLAHAKYRKANFAKWTRDEYSALLKEHKLRAQYEQSNTQVRYDVAVKLHAFVESVKAIAPDVERVSWYRLVNHFLPMFTWEVSDLTGEPAKEWITFLTVNIPLNAETGDKKAVPVASLVKAIEDEKTRQAAEKRANDKRTADQIDAAERRAENAKIVAKRNKAVSRISDAVVSAFESDTLNGKDVLDTIQSVSKTMNVNLPSIETTKTVVTPFDPVNATIDDIQTAISALFAKGKIAEIRAINQATHDMIESFKLAIAS